MNDHGAPALNDPRTREALRGYRRRGLRASLVGFGALVVATVVIGAAPDGDPKGIAGAVALFGIGGGGVVLVAGASGLWRSVRMRWLLKRHPWSERRAAYRIAPLGANGQPALVIKEDSSAGEAVCSVPATVWRYRQLEQGPDIPLLVVGNPRRWSVVAPPDRHVLLVAKRPWVPFWGRKLRRYALPDG